MHIFDGKKTILLTNIWLQYFGGSEVNCLSLAKALKEKGYNVEVATLEAKEPMISEFMRENILVKNVLEQDLMRSHYDIIWAHHAVVLDYVLFSKKVTADKIVLSSLSPFEPYECLPGYANVSSLCLANSMETRQKLIDEGVEADKIVVFPNYVSAEWLNRECDRTYGKAPGKIAIVSNHVPEELLQAKDILTENGCEVDIYGLGHKVELIKPETLQAYDLVITIGKTVQYAMALQIPVYCYDVHGGPGYLTGSDLVYTAFYNFSGRGFPKKNAKVIAAEIMERYEKNLDVMPELLDYVRENAILENNIEDVLATVDQTENVNITEIQQKYAYRDRSNRAVLRLMQEKKSVEQNLTQTEQRYNVLFAANERCYVELQRNERMVADFQKSETEMKQALQSAEQNCRETEQKLETAEQNCRETEQKLETAEQNCRETEQKLAQVLADDSKIKELEARCRALSAQCEEAVNARQASERMVQIVRQSYEPMETHYNKIIRSRGWRYLNYLYNIRNVVLPMNSLRYKLVKAILKPLLMLRRKIRNRKISAGTMAAPTVPGVGVQVVPTPAAENAEPVYQPMPADQAFEMMKSCRRIDIMAVGHTAYIAQMLQGILLDAGLESCIHLTEPEQYEDIPYIMICPQNFKKFPPVYIAFQMEQTVSARWLTDEYLQILRNAYAIFDYSLVNIKYFRNDPSLASKLYYIPVDIGKSMMQQHPDENEKECDVLFYGAPFIERRQEFLKPISEKFNFWMVYDKFGTELYEMMKKAKIVVNVHYYQNALLETTRIYETLSVTDSLVISERSTDPKEEERLEGIVDFTEIGDVQGMLDRISYWLEHEEERKQKVAENRRELKERANAAKFYLYRFLLANECVTFDQFYNAVGNFIHFEGNRVCLSLPESTERHEAFEADNQYGFEFFPGLKHRLGWIGCGMSYKFMFRKALEQKLDQILICEDDVYFPPDFDERFSKVLEYTENNDDWTVFSGIMADLGRVKPLKYVEENGEEYIYLNKMISMVFNLYNKEIFEPISNWDNMNRDVNSNTIDRYLENREMRILTTCPFLVGHKEDLCSTIWGAQNTIYSELITNSSVKLREIVDKYKRSCAEV